MRVRVQAQSKRPLLEQQWTICEKNDTCTSTIKIKHNHKQSVKTKINVQAQLKIKKRMHTQTICEKKVKCIGIIKKKRHNL